MTHDESPAAGRFSGYYFTGVLLLISPAVIIGASYTAAAPNEEKLEFTHGQVTPEQRAENREVGRAAMWVSVAVVALILVIYLCFSVWL